MTVTTPSILIIDDEPGIVDFLALGLGYEGFQTRSAGDGATGLQMALADPPDLIILDLMLPRLDGFALLELLIRHPDQVLPRETILDRVWGYDFGGDGNIIEVYVRYLRQKLGAPNPIQTVRGVGYVMKTRRET